MKFLYILICIISGYFLAGFVRTLSWVSDFIYFPIVLNDTAEFDDARYMLLGQYIGIFFFMFVSLCVFAKSASLYRRSSRKCRGGNNITKEDVKKPFILYLRSFADEKRTKKLVSKLFDLRSEEEILVEVFNDVAPVYAIGNPADKKMPYGASRIYVSDDEWKSTVKQLANRAEVVILRLGRTDSFWWEVEMALKEVPIQKIVFIVPWGKDKENVQTLNAILRNSNIDVSNLDLNTRRKRKGSISSVLYFDAERKPVSKVISMPRFTGFFLSYEQMLKYALGDFMSKFGVATREKLPVLKSRILFVTTVLFLTIFTSFSYADKFIKLKTQRPYELVEECVKNDVYTSQYGNQLDDLNLKNAIVAGTYGVIMLDDEEYLRKMVIEKEVLQRVSGSEMKVVYDNGLNLLLMIKKYAPEDYSEYVKLLAKAAILYISNPSGYSSLLMLYQENLNNLPAWVSEAANSITGLDSEQADAVWSAEISKHMDDEDIAVIIKTLNAVALLQK